MTLLELETLLGVTFPKKWHAIYATGAMEWMTLDADEFRANRDAYIYHPNAFLMIEGDCEPLFFDEISEWLEELKEWISWKEEDEEVTLKSNIKLIPFAQTGAGDLYCFFYQEEKEEPEIVLYLHDDYDTPDIIADSFESFLYIVMLQAAFCGEDIHGAAWKAHMQLLEDQYKNKIYGKSDEELAAEYEALPVKKVDIWQSVSQ